jgi:hypothetical protein
MGVKPGIRFSDELLIESLPAAGFVACDKEDGLALRVEGESDAPLPSAAGSVALSCSRDGNRSTYRHGDDPIAARIVAGAARGQGFRDIIWQRLKLRLELIADFDVPPTTVEPCYVHNA